MTPEDERMLTDFKAMLTDVTGAAVCLIERDSGLCGRAATVHIEVGCVHEHVCTQEVCEGCARRIETAAAYCNVCRRTGERHECLLLGRRVEP